MARIPSLNATKIIRALKKTGFIEDRQKGSHLILIHPGTKARTVVPIHHGKTLKKKLVRGIIADTMVPQGEFLKLL